MLLHFATQILHDSSPCRLNSRNFKNAIYTRSQKLNISIYYNKKYIIKSALNFLIYSYLTFMLNYNCL